MTLCSITGAHCSCQPDQGEPCPDRAYPTAWIVAIILFRGDGSKSALHQRLVFNVSEAKACQKQWPEQLYMYWDWPPDKYPGYEVDVELIPLYK